MKYKTMMDGLEAVEVNFSQLSKIIDFRIESEYFDKKFLKIDALLQNYPTTNFIDAASPINGRPYCSDSFNSNLGVYVSKIGDVTNKRAAESWDYVEKGEFDKQKGSLLRDGDILMTLTGDPPDVGKVNMIICNGLKCTWNQRVAKINIKDNGMLSNNVLYAILSSEVCRTQMERFAKGIRQRNLGNECFERVKLPCLPESIKVAIDRIVLDSINFLNESRKQYKLSENILLSELGIENFSLSNNAVTVKSLSESYLSSGRLDAEYYQTKYEDYETFLDTNETVDSLCILHDKNFTPKEDFIYKYIELANVGVSGNIEDVESIIGKYLPSRARRKVKKGQVIISSVEGSLQSCALITDEYDGALCSTGFYVLNSNQINPETLLVLFKSEPVQALLKQRCSGTILTAITKNELLRMPLLKIDVNIQNLISKKIQQSSALRCQSEKLLETAKKAVNIAIEQNEETAIKWLKEKYNQITRGQK